MKKIILRYGFYAAIAELAFFVLTWVVIALFSIGHKGQGWIGYIDLICPLLFVYFGIRYYRDQLNNGHISFLKALKIGLLIVILPTVAFGLIESVYVLYIEPDFYKNVAAYDIEQYRKTLSPAQFAVKMKQINLELEAEKNPVYNFVAVSAAVGSVGILITLVSALLLMKKPVLCRKS